MSISSSKGWRSVIVEHFPDRLPGQFNASDLGQVDVVQVLSPDDLDPTQQQLDDLAATFARDGGYATARVVGRFWFGVPQLTWDQQRALEGLP